MKNVLFIIFANLLLGQVLETRIYTVTVDTFDDIEVTWAELVGYPLNEGTVSLYGYNYLEFPDEYFDIYLTYGETDLLYHFRDGKIYDTHGAYPNSDSKMYVNGVGGFTISTFAVGVDYYGPLVLKFAITAEFLYDLEEDGGIGGDVNNDGTLNVADVVQLVNIILEN